MACCPGSMTAMFINIIPEFRHDQAVQRLMVASTSSILSAVVDILMLGISLEDISVPPAAAEYARRFAQHDLSLEALLRAYRLGEHTFLQWVIQDLSQRAMPADDALAVTSRIALLVNGYIDRVIEGLTKIYQTERQRWEDRSDATRTAQVRAVLATEGLTTSMAEQMLGPGAARVAHRGGCLGQRQRLRRPLDHRVEQRARSSAHRYAGLVWATCHPGMPVGRRPDTR